MAFAAETSSVPLLAWWLLGINTIWSVVYDTLYAMVDRDDDLAVGIKSTAILFGRFDIMITGALMLIMIVLLLTVGVAYGLAWPWFVAAGVSAILFARQLIRIRSRGRDDCFAAFLNNNWVGFSIFAGLVGHFTVSGFY